MLGSAFVKGYAVKETEVLAQQLQSLQLIVEFEFNARRSFFHARKSRTGIFRNRRPIRFVSIRSARKSHRRQFLQHRPTTKLCIQTSNLLGNLKL